MKRTSGRILAFALAFAMVAAMVPAIPVRAVESVDYIDENGDLKTCDTYTVVNTDTTSWDASTSEWYVVNSAVTISSRINVSGNVNLILADGGSLTASQGIGIKTTGKSSSLTIYGQSEQKGKLTATGTNGNAAIGGNSGEKDNYVTDSNIAIKINGGIINATASGSGAGIGAGYQARTGAITINRGTVTAKAGDGNAVGSSSSGDGTGGGAGIGSAAGNGTSTTGYSGNITINGGTVKATGGPGGAGIGGGYRTKVPSVTINGGNITATGGAIYTASNEVTTTRGSFGAGIGGGAGLTSSNTTVTISGGTITAIGGKHPDLDARASGIGNYYATDISSPVSMNLNISGGIIYATSIDEKAKGNQGGWSGVIFDGADGKVYGSPDITEKIDLTAPSEIRSTGITTYTLDVPGGSTLTVGNGGSITIPSSRTLNVGTKESPDAKLVLDGGTVSNQGTVEVYGDVEGSISGSGKVNYHYRVEPKISFTNVTYGYVQPDAKEIDVANTGLDSVTIDKVEHENDENFTLTSGDVGNLAANSSNKNFKLQPNAGLSAGTYKDTVTVTYTVQGSETPRTATAEVEFTVEKAESEVTPSEADMTVTYGEPVTLSVKVKRQGASGIALASAEPDFVEFTFQKGSKTMTAPVTYDNETNKDSGTASVTIEADQVKNYFNIGSNTVNVSYGGSVNLANNDDATITVNLSQKALTFTFTPEARDYEAGNTNVTGKLNETDETGKVTTGLVGSDDVTATAEATVATPDAGTDKTVTVTVKLEGADAAYYKANEITDAKVTISKAASKVTKAPEGQTLNYNGSEQGLVTAGEADGGDLMYYVGDENPGTDAEGWTEEVSAVTGTDAKEYTIWYYVKGDSNHNDTTPQSVTAKISKIAVSMTEEPAAKKGLVYTGAEQDLITAGKTDDGTIKYALGDDSGATNYSTEIPKAANAGDYHVWYMVEGDDDHENTEPTKIDVTIAQATSSVTVGEVDSATYGSDITLTANITASDVTDTTNITGKVTFKAGTVELGTATAANGTATLTIKDTDGTNQKALFDNSTNVTAEYAGNDNITKSTSDAKKVTVSPKELSFSFTADEKTYNGDTNVTGALTRDTELVSGDTDVQASYTATASSKDVGPAVNVTVTVTLDGEDAQYYKAVNPTGVTVKIVKANIGDSAVTAPTGATNLTYNGAEQGLIQSAGTATGGTMKYYVGETAPALDAADWKNTFTDIKAKDAGKYTVWYYVVGDPNHNDTTAESIEVEIGKKEVELEWTGGTEFTYTGNEQGVSVTVKTGVEGEELTATVEGATGVDVKDYTAKVTALVDGETGDADNYKLPDNVTQNYSIKQATPTVEVKASDNPTYGDAITLTAEVSSGEIGKDKLGGTVQFKIGGENFGDSVSVDTSTGKATLTISGTDRDKQHTLFGENGTVSVTADYSGNGNITEKTSSATEVKVSQKTLTFTFNASNKTYDGNENVSGNFADFSSQLVSGDDVNIKTYTATTENANVEDSKTVTVEVTALEGADSKYYTPGEATSNAINITKAEATNVVAPKGKSGLTYNGRNQELIETAGSATGGEMKYYVGEKNVNAQPGADVEWKESAAITGKDAGTYTVWYKVVGDPNHNDTTPGSINVKIEPKEVGLTWTGYESLTYTGSAHTISATVNNKEGDDDVSVTVEVKANDDGGSASGATATNAGSYTAKATQLTGSAAGNYKLPDNPTQDFTIGKATVSVDTITKTLTYTTQPQTVGTVTVNTGDAPALAQGSGYSVLYTASESVNSNDGTENKTDVGEYKVWVKLSGEAFKNYQFDGGAQEKNVGTMEITQATLILNVSGSEITYGQTLSESELSGTATISGGTEITGNWAWDEAVASSYPTVSKDSENTEYTVKFTPTSSGASNFTEGSLSKKITIKVNPYELTPQVESVDGKIYDGNVTAQNGKLKFAENLDIVPFKDNKPSASGTFTFTDKNVGENKHVKVTDIKLDNSTDYTLKADSISDAVTTAKITAKPVTLTWDGYNDLTYSGTAKSVTATTTDFVDGDKDTVNIVFADHDKTDAGTYTAKASLVGGDAGNYSITNAEHGYTIAKSPVTFTVSDNEVTYDGEAKEVTLENTNTSDAPELEETSGYTVTYGTDNAESKTDVGEYAIHIKLTTEAAKNYKFAGKDDSVTELTVEGSKLTIGKASSTVSDVSIVAGDGELTYGDGFTVSAKVNAPGNVTGKVTFTAGSVELGEVASHEGNVWTITVGANDKEKQHAIFDNKAITAEYSGDGNINGNSGSNEAVTVEKKPLEYTVTAEGRVWNGETGVEVALEATNLVTGDAVTLSAKGDLDNRGNAGTYRTVNLSEVEIGGADMGYYTTEEARKDVTLTSPIDIEKAASSVTAPVGKAGLSYKGEPLALINAATESDGGTVKYYVGENAPADGADGWKTAVSDITGTDVGEYTVWYYVDGDGNHNDTAFASLTVKIDPAKVSFSIGKEDKVDWATRGETNDDPNPDGYVIAEDTTPDDWTDHALTMTYDSYNHKARVAQTEGEAVEILAGTTNGYSVTYKRVKDSAGNGVTEDAIGEIHDAGTYEILVTINPTEGGVYNYVFDGQDGATRTLKIGTIAVEPYTVRVTWTHLKYVYHAHAMHPTIRVQNAFNSDIRRTASYPSSFDTNNPDAYTGDRVVPFASTDGANVGEYTVQVKLYGKNAGNYTVEDDTETVTIVPAPVTFTVADNIWVVREDGTLSRDTVTLKPAWGAVTVEPDVAVHDSYPAAGTAVRSELETEIQYRSGDVTYTEAPTEAGEYEVWVKIGNGNFRHTAGADGEFHNVGALIITNDPSSITRYTVTFDLGGYDGGASAPAGMTGVFANQTVVLPAVGVEWVNHIFQGWSYGGVTYLPNEEFHMPSADVTFEAQWLDEENIRNVGGIVKQEQKSGDPVALYGATVTLKQGSNEIGETSTEADGSFNFENLVPGIYNLEIRYNDGKAEVVKTFYVDVEETSLDEEYILPEGALNTVVEADITAVADLESIVEEPSDEGIYTPDDVTTVSDGGTVEFKMSITSKTLGSDETEELPVPAERVGMSLDIKLTKTVTESTGTAAKPVTITDTKAPIKTVIHLPPELQGKSSYTIYRFHEEAGETEVQTITTSPNENGEYLEVIREGTAIELHAQFYSTYVLTWNQITNSSYRITLPEATANGKLTADRTMASRGRTVTLTATPDEGCHLRSLTVTDKNGNAVELTAGGDGTYTFVQPASRVNVEAEFVKCLSMDYTDIDLDAWYHEYTDRVIESGLMLGVGDGVFAPNGTVTRAQMVTALWHMSGDAETDYDMDYADVSEGDWYCEAIAWATEAAVVNGYGNGKFGPNDPITREQMATMLYRYEQNLGGGGFTDEWMYRLPFTDIEDISDWSFEAVAWCNMEGVVLGKENDTFDPQGEAKRSEMAAVLTRFSEGAEE